jgi:hypothetical protein
VRDLVGDARDIFRAAGGALFENVRFDLLLDRRIGLRQQVAISAGLSVVAEKLVARRIDGGVFGIVLGWTVQ